MTMKVTVMMILIATSDALEFAQETTDSKRRENKKVQRSSITKLNRNRKPKVAATLSFMIFDFMRSNG